MGRLGKMKNFKLLSLFEVQFKASYKLICHFIVVKQN